MRPHRLTLIAPNAGINSKASAEALDQSKPQPLFQRCDAPAELRFLLSKCAPYRKEVAVAHYLCKVGQIIHVGSHHRSFDGTLRVGFGD
jgi:hypothetical protein